MEKGWRPEGWENPHSVALQFDAFEAGADAMRKALKKKGAWMTPEQMKLLAPGRKYPYGYIVFIPDDEKPVNIPVFKLTLEEATHKAERFLRDLARVHFYHLIDTEQCGNIWKLRYDIGVLRKTIAEVVIDDKTGEIESYEVLPAPGKTPN